jgi:Bacterial regulatory proteins, luxR family
MALFNSEIADALTLSARTIEGHIYRACARVGAATRTELAQVVTEFVPVHDPSATADGRRRRLHDLTG